MKPCGSGSDSLAAADREASRIHPAGWPPTGPPIDSLASQVCSVNTPLPSALFDLLSNTAADQGIAAMLTALGDELTRERRWHALFDLRLMQARLAEGLPVVGDAGTLAPAVRDAFEERSRQACLEVGWPLLDDGQVAAAWMYLRASAELEEVATRLEHVASTLDSRTDDEDARRLLEELVHVALWEAVNPPLGLTLLLAHNGTCNTITAYDQSVSRLPPARQAAAARVLVEHLTSELIANLQSDLSRRGVDSTGIDTLPGMLAAAGDPSQCLGPHVDVSHLHSVLRFARVCSDPETLTKSLELARYADRLPEELRYPGDGPFTELAKASRLFYAACLGDEIEAATAFFSEKAGLTAGCEPGAPRGPLEQLAVEYLIVLLSRGGQPAKALRIALAYLPRGGEQAATTGLVPPVVELAAAAEAITPGSMQQLLDACRERADAVTFAQALAVRAGSGTS
jgi:hypothetical protein